MNDNNRKIREDLLADGFFILQVENREHRKELLEFILNNYKNLNPAAYQHLKEVIRQIKDLEDKQ